MMMVMMLVVVVVTANGAGCLAQVCQFILQSGLTLHSSQDLLSAQRRPRGGDDGCLRVFISQKRHGSIQLFVRNTVGTAEDDATGVLYLIVVKLAEVFGVSLAFAGIRHGCKGIQLHIVGCNFLHGFDHVTEFAYTGGLNQDAVRRKLLQHLRQGLGEITHQTATDTPGVHLVDLDAGFLHKTAVNADLAELVFDEHQLLAGIGLLDQFFNQSRLAGTQKAGENIDLGHFVHSFLYSVLVSIPHPQRKFNRKH